MAQEYVNKFMAAFDKTYLNIAPDIRDRVVECLNGFVEAGKDHIDKPANAENLELFMVSAMMTKYGPNFSKKTVQNWSRFAYHPQANQTGGVAIFMYQACLEIQGEKAASIILAMPVETWTDKLTVWEALCIVPFFFIVKEK